jgi:Protein of unknown function (DUF559)
MVNAALDALRKSPFTLQEALAAGLSRSRLNSLVLERRVRRVVHGVYADASLPDTLDNRIAALHKVMRPHVVVCGRTAAWLYGVDMLSYAELEILPGAETCVLPTQNRMRHADCKGARRELSSSDVVRLGALCVTSPLRTALDLGCGLRRRDALAALDWFLRLEYFDQSALLGELSRFARRRRVVQLRELVALADGRAESPGESWTRISLIDEGLPAPELQWRVIHNGRELFRLDLAYHKHKVCVEYDGEEFHDTPEARAHDEARRAWLRAHGWIVIVVRKEAFAADARLAWVSEVRTALASRHR